MQGQTVFQIEPISCKCSKLTKIEILLLGIPVLLLLKLRRIIQRNLYSTFVLTAPENMKIQLTLLCSLLLVSLPEFCISRDVAPGVSERMLSHISLQCCNLNIICKWSFNSELSSR